MYRYIVNFGAAAVAALAVACSSASSKTASSDSAASDSQQPTSKKLNAPDPLVVAADRGRIAGDSTSRTWVVIASDFQCPFCREWHATSYRSLVDDYVKTGKVRVAYLHFPLGQHQNAVPTANAAMCAGVQNRFWEYHDALFESQARWAPMPDARPVLDSIAQAVGVEKRAWKQCFESGRMLPLIRADRDRAAAGGVQSTPTFLIGGQVIAGAVPWETLRPVIDAAVARDRPAGRTTR